MKSFFYTILLPLSSMVLLTVALCVSCQNETPPATVSSAVTEPVLPSESMATETTSAAVAEPVSAAADHASSPTSEATAEAVPATNAKAASAAKPLAARTKTPPTAKDAAKPVAKAAVAPRKTEPATKTDLAAEPDIMYKGSESKASAKSGAAITFDETSFEFGTVAVGTIIKHDFAFKNTGTIPLIIQDATSTCGCTIPEIPETPIMPGQSSKIHVEFDSKGKIGTQNKVVTVLTNAGTREIALKGLILTENLLKKDEPK